MVGHPNLIAVAVPPTVFPSSFHQQCLLPLVSGSWSCAPSSVWASSSGVCVVLSFNGGLHDQESEACASGPKSALNNYQSTDFVA